MQRDKVRFLFSCFFFFFAVSLDIFVIYFVCRAADPDDGESVPLVFIDEVSTPSDAGSDDPRENEQSTILQGISDVLQSWNDVILGEDVPDNDNEDYEIMEVSADDFRFNLTHGVALYRIRYGGSTATAAFPLASAENLSVTSDGILINTGTNNISGRIFTSNYVDSYSSGYAVTLLPVLTGNIFSQLYNNGHSAYVTYYYNSSGRVQSSNTYYTIYCDDYVLLPPVNSLQGHSYFVDIIVILLLGGVLLCLLRRSWS